MIAFFDRLACEPNGSGEMGDRDVGLMTIRPKMHHQTSGHLIVLPQLSQSSTDDRRPRPSAVRRTLPVASPEEDRPY
jgi:hypothetical protein